MKIKFLVDHDELRTVKKVQADVVRKRNSKSILDYPAARHAEIPDSELYEYTNIVMLPGATCWSESMWKLYDTYEEALAARKEVLEREVKSADDAIRRNTEHLNEMKKILENPLSEAEFLKSEKPTPPTE